MATALDIAKRNSNAAPVAVSDAARAAGLDTLAIEKKAELSVVPGMALGGTTLVGLTRDQLKDKLGEIGVPERERKMRVGPALALDLSPGRQRLRRDDQCGQGPARGAERGLYARPPRGRLRAGVEGRHPQVADPHGADGAHDKGAEIECVYIPEAIAARSACRARSAAR